MKLTSWLVFSKNVSERGSKDNYKLKIKQGVMEGEEKDKGKLLPAIWNKFKKRKG